ncbi:hypothetical protein ANN_05517 [Periplaneta americana]|uniref:Per a allergen n=1 Tax=Periplaneta americana TaxID=6978 RepID=A0ABQ8TB67_PERAM|nr:hypothetical protein ANN_05517 [Periplaneta americana]
MEETLKIYNVLVDDIGHIRQHICLTWSQATKGNIEGGRFDPVLWIEFGVDQWSERLELHHRITAAVAIINCDMLERVREKMNYRIDICRISEGGNIEHFTTTAPNNKIPFWLLEFWHGGSIVKLKMY